LKVETQEEIRKTEAEAKIQTELVNKRAEERKKRRISEKNSICTI